MPGVRNTGMKAAIRHLNQLRKKLWKNPEIINDLFSEEEWLKQGSSDGPDQEKSEKMHRYILQGISKEQQEDTPVYSLKSRLLILAKYAAAAVVFVLLGVALWMNQWRPQLPAVNTSQITEVKKQNLVSPAVWEIVTNKTSRLKKVHLPDLSVVDLYPHGTLKYEKSFSKNLRNVYLTGKAYFKVKRNPKRPFSVFAGGLKTTALGTSFTINTKAGHLKTSVNLHTGKIVVAPEDQASKQRPLYLTKAESGLIFDRELQLSALIKPVVQVQEKQTLPMSLHRNGRILTMQNIPLADVVKLLTESYQVKILANSQDISNITYTGVVNPEKETIESVLQVIALINNMTVSKTEDQQYILKKNSK